MRGRDIPFKLAVASLLAAAGISLAAALPAGAEANSERAADLLAQLRGAAPGEDERIVNALLTEWSKSGSATLDLLFQRGVDALNIGDFAGAVGHLTAAIDHGPGFAEAYAARAQAYYAMGDVGPAIDDLRQTLVLNPAQFEAMFGFAVILEELGRPEEALEVYRLVQDIHPADAATDEAIRRIETGMQGQPL